MDDDEGLGPLFRAAAAGTPPPRFDHADVVRASDRAGARRRSVLVVGAVALAVLVGAGGVGAAVLQQRTGTETSAASAPALDSQGTVASPAAAGSGAAGGAAAGGAGVGSGATGNPSSGLGVDAPVAPPDPAQPLPGPVRPVPGPARPLPGPAQPLPGPAQPLPGPAQARPAPEAAGPRPGAARPGIVPLGPGHGTCADRQDPALRALVDDALPEAVGAPAAATSDLCEPGTWRSVSIELRADVLTVGYLPPGTTPSLAAGFTSAPTASGGTVIVSAGHPTLLTYLAPRL